MLPKSRVRHIFDDQSKYCEPVSNVAKDDVAKEASNVEEGGGDVRPLGVVAHQVEFRHQCVRVLGSNVHCQYVQKWMNSWKILNGIAPPLNQEKIDLTIGKI